MNYPAASFGEYNPERFNFLFKNYRLKEDRIEIRCLGLVITYEVIMLKPSFLCVYTGEQSSVPVATVIFPSLGIGYPFSEIYTLDEKTISFHTTNNILPKNDPELISMKKFIL